MSSNKISIFLTYISFFVFSFAHAGFVEDTLIKTSQGFTPIQEVAIGDSVVSFNEDTDEFQMRAVTDISTHKVNRLIHIHVTGYAINSHIIADAHQPFYVPIQKKWCHAQDLKPGMVLQSCYEQQILVNEVQEVALDAVIYELTIDEYHNFCVTGDGIVVHNFVIVIPIVLSGGGLAFLASAAKAIGIGVGVGLFYKVVSDLTGSTIDHTIDVSNPNLFDPIYPLYTPPGHRDGGGIFEQGKNEFREEGSIECVSINYPENSSTPRPPCILPPIDYDGGSNGGCSRPLPPDELIGTNPKPPCVQPPIIGDGRTGGCVRPPHIFDQPKDKINKLPQEEYGEPTDYFLPFPVNQIGGNKRDEGVTYKKGQAPKAPDPDGPQAPGLPRPENNFKPRKNWHGEKVWSPRGYGWPDKYGNIWVPTGPFGHRGPHWDVQRPDGSHDNVLPEERFEL